MKRHNSPRFGRSNGAILFVSLIMLLLLTLLGITAMQVTMLQERMSGNFRAQNVAFQRSEGKLSEGRDNTEDPLYKYDNISPVPVQLLAGYALPWDSWFTASPPTREFLEQVRACGGACPEARGSIVGIDPERKPRFYIITGQERDPGTSSPESAAWAALQTIYVN